MIREQLKSNIPEESQEYSFDTTDNNTKKEEGDLDMFYLKACEDNGLYPFVSMLSKMTLAEKNINLEIKNFRLNDKWC